jgi:hypothetical protein
MLIDLHDGWNNPLYRGEDRSLPMNLQFSGHHSSSSNMRLKSSATSALDVGDSGGKYGNGSEGVSEDGVESITFSTSRKRE